MEENRLKPMPLNYDEAKFNLLFSKTEGLRRKLTSEIDARRFGVDYQEVLSWFSVKFIHAFSKYHDQFNDDILLGHLIKSLQFFKCRIIKGAYTLKNSQTILPFDDIDQTEMKDLGEDEESIQYERLINFIGEHVSDNALTLLDMQLHPCPFILRRLKEKGIENIHKIPDDVFCEYFDLGLNNRSIKYIGSLKKELKMAFNLAKDHFKN